MIEVNSMSNITYDFRDSFTGDDYLKARYSNYNQSTYNSNGVLPDMNSNNLSAYWDSLFGTTTPAEKLRKEQQSKGLPDQSTNPYLQGLDLGINAFDSYLAYKNYQLQRKIAKENIALGRANYTNQAKAYNEAITQDARFAQGIKGNSTNAIDRYLAQDKNYKNRLVRTTL